MHLKIKNEHTYHKKIFVYLNAFKSFCTFFYWKFEKDIILPPLGGRIYILFLHFLIIFCFFYFFLFFVDFELF